MSTDSPTDARGARPPVDPSDDRPVLALDTATAFLSVALWSPSRGIWAERRERVERDHAARLLPVLIDLFSDVGMDAPTSASPGARAAPVRAIVVGIGPGSYTGLRVGNASARGLARAWAIPLYGADTLAALASVEAGRRAPDPSPDASADEGPHAREAIWGVIDARRGNVYAGRYRGTGAHVETIVAPAKIPRSSLPEKARVAEDVAPDPAALAASIRFARSPEPIYL